MIRIRFVGVQEVTNVAEVLLMTGEQIRNGERPGRIHDQQGHAIGFVEMDFHAPIETEETVTFIAGELYRWAGFPGSWERFTPTAGQLMRMHR
jgi:hypothetical protein